MIVEERKNVNSLNNIIQNLVLENINKLSIDTQEVIVEGEINNLGYSDHSKKEQDGGLFSKIFK